MAVEKQGKIRITATTELDALNSVVSKLEEMRSKFVSATTTGQVLGNVITGALERIKGAVAGAISQTERWYRATEEQMTSLRNLSTAVGGVVGTTDLYRLRNRMMTGDLAITERQMQALEKGGVLLGRAMGVSATEGANRLADAVQGGRGLERAMRMLGINVQFTGDNSYKAAQALEALEQRMGGVDIQAKNAGERLTALKSSVSLAWAEMITAVKKTDAWKDSMAGLASAIGLAGKALRMLLPGKMSGADAAALAEGLGATGTVGSVPGMREALARTAAFVREYGGDARSGPPSGTTFNVRDENGKLIFSEEEGMTLTGHKTGAPARGGRGRAGGPALWKENAAKQRAAFEAYLERTTKRGEDRERRDMELGWAARDRGIEYKHQKELEAKLEANRKEMEAMDALDEKRERGVEITRKHNQAMRDMATGGLAELTGGMWAAADAAIQGGKSFDEAMVQMIKSTLLGIAQQATVKAIFATAEGFMLQAATMGMPNPGSIAAFTAAGMYAAVAAGTGAAGLAISAATAGGGKSAGGAPASSGGGYRPSFGQSAKSRDLPPIVVRVTFDRSDPASEQFARRKVKAQLLQAGYEEGA